MSSRIGRESFVEENIFDEYKFTSNGYVIEIGNDVWIGANVTIMEGVTIADGTVIAEGSNVVADTKPYSVVGGNPAKVLRYRFQKEQIEYLLSLKWWDKPEQWIERNASYFKDIELLINNVKVD